MSSGYALIYDKAGVNPFCLSSTKSQIENLIDDRTCRVSLFSETANAFSNPVHLFVIPGGSYREMADELEPFAPEIRRLIIEMGTSYLGICAGAVAALSHPPLMHNERLGDDSSIHALYELPTLLGHMHLKLYSGNGSLFLPPGSNFWGTQEVSKFSPDKEQKPHHLFFRSGIFFPDAAQQPDTLPLLRYTFCKFSGFYNRPEGSRETYRNIDPVAAVTQKVGKGRLLLSGAHTEITAAVVQRFPTTYTFQERAKARTIASLTGSEAAQEETMRDYLSALSIATKKV